MSAGRRLSAAALKKAVEERKRVRALQHKATAQQRLEAQQRRKEELKRAKDDAEANGELTPEQIRKREEKEYRLQLKNKKPRVKIMR